MTAASLVAKSMIALDRWFHIEPMTAAPGELKPVPGNAGIPLVGHAAALFGDPLTLMRSRYERYGPVSWMRFMGRRMVVALGPDAAEVVLRNRDRAFANGPGWAFWIGPFFERGLMLLDGDEHLHHRRIMQQAFTNERIHGYLAGMNPAIARRIGAWQLGHGIDPRFGVLAALKQLTLDLATEVFMGAPLAAAEARPIQRAFVDTVRAGLALVRYDVPGGRWSRGLAARRRLERFFRRRLPSHRAGTGNDLFSVLCQARTEDGQSFTDDDVVNHMIFLLMAAHDTTTITMAAMWYLLAKHPAWQERVRRESLALGKSQLAYEDLAALTSLDLVMREAMRIVAPVPYLGRKTVRDTSICGFFVPRDTLVTVAPHFTHHMAAYWPDPERFDPERFAPARREDKSHAFAWEPFGGGVHKCIGLHFAGMQIKAIFHQVLLRYRWSVAPGYRTTFDFTALPVPKDGLPVRLEPRD